MTQKALGVTPVEDGFQVQQGRNRKKNSSGGQSTPGSHSPATGLDRRNSAPNILQRNNGRQPLSQAERIKNGVCPNYPRNFRFGDVCKFQYAESKGKTEKQNARSVGVTESNPTCDPDIEKKLDQISAALTLFAQTYSGVAPPRRECIISALLIMIMVHFNITGFSLFRLVFVYVPATHACVRTVGSY